jgi:hypothetical protein
MMLRCAVGEMEGVIISHLSNILRLAPGGVKPSR